MKSSRLLVAIACLLFASQSSAAPITFTNAPLTSTGDVDTTGVWVSGFNTGGGGKITVGGIVYSDGGIPLGNGFIGANPLAAVGNANFDALLNSASYGTNSLSLAGLTVGNNYRVQLFMTDNRACCNTRTVTVGDGVGGTLTTPAIGPPQSVFGDFTATATMQTVTFDGSAGLGYLNGYQLRNLSSDSAPVTFTLGTLTGAGDISTNGTLVTAQNTGGGAAVTVNGVTFNPGGNPLGNGFTGANPGNLTSDANLNALLDSSSFGTVPVVLTGLTPGDDYEFQAFITDNRSCCSGRTVQLVDGIANSVTTAGIGTPQFVLGTFTAAGTEQTIFFNGSENFGYLNGFQLRNVTAAVPEPKALLTWSLAGLTLLGTMVARLQVRRGS
jgi:hypothetical protein